MEASLSRRIAALRTRRGPSEATHAHRADEATSTAACSWDALRAVYEEQAARGVPEAIAGLELIEQDRWPTSGRPRNP